MRNAFLAILMAELTSTKVAAAIGTSAKLETTKLAILGVYHSAQLVLEAPKSQRNRR
jgi:hypothetical protein